MADKLITFENFLQQLASSGYGGHSYQQKYRAFYSSWLGGYSQDPRLLLIPVDDHLVHRGDGVFEANKFINGRVFLFKEHLQRLKRSAAKISLTLPKSIGEIEEISQKVIEFSGLKNGVLRIFVSRGPGDFSPNPYSARASQIIIVAIEQAPAPERLYQEGVKVGKSQIPVKDSFFAQIKSCNYLANVLQKKEAVDLGLDYTVGFNTKGHLAEGSTENIFILDRQKVMRHPLLSDILSGTTMGACFLFAEQLKKEGLINGVAEGPISEPEMLESQAMMMASTIYDVVPVRQYKEKTFSDFNLAYRLNSLLKVQQEKT